MVGGRDIGNLLSLDNLTENVTGSAGGASDGEEGLSEDVSLEDIFD